MKFNGGSGGRAVLCFVAVVVAFFVVVFFFFLYRLASYFLFRSGRLFNELYTPHLHIRSG